MVSAPSLSRGSSPGNEKPALLISSDRVLIREHQPPDRDLKDPKPPLRHLFHSISSFLTYLIFKTKNLLVLFLLHPLPDSRFDSSADISNPVRSESRTGFSDRKSDSRFIYIGSTGTASWLHLLIFYQSGCFHCLSSTGGRGQCALTTLQSNLPWDKISTTYPDRKSTRLNSSHVAISYAVFCLKKNKQ